MSNDMLQSISAAAIALAIVDRLAKDAVPRFGVFNWIVMLLAVVIVGMFWAVILPSIAALLTTARFWDWKGRDLAAKYWPWG